MIRTTTQPVGEPALDCRAQLLEAVKSAVLAPSTYNTQPWIFRVGERSISLFADHSRARPYADPDGRELILSCGAALLQLRLALRNAGYEYELYCFPEASQPDWLAEIRISGEHPPTEQEQLLYRMIPQRHTQRQAFDPRPISPSALRKLQSVAVDEIATLRPITESGQQKLAADLVAEADRLQWEDPRFCREWRQWYRGSQSAAVDGLPGYAFGMNATLSQWTPLLMRTLPAQSTRFGSVRFQALSAPVMAAIETGGDTPSHWLHAGQALARVLLAARAEGLSASFLNQPIQVANSRQKLRCILGARGYPQVLMRLGYALDATATPRRDLNEVVQDANLNGSNESIQLQRGTL